MKEKIKSVYYCEHCNKHGLMKHVILFHEKLCYKNPDNFRPCKECLNLTKATTTSTSIFSPKDSKNDIDKTEFEVTLFFCKAKNTFLYSPQNEIKGNYFIIKESNIPMPRECDSHEPWEAFEITDYDDIDF